MEEWEYSDYFDCWTHRPLIDWTEQDVIDIHHRFGLAPNRLYLNGSHRVGCYPCIYSRKSEIKQMTQDRISFIAELEKMITEARGKQATMFSSKNGQIMGIEDVYLWSQTTRGGKQYELFSRDEPTCVKWGMCER